MQVNTERAGEAIWPKVHSSLMAAQDRHLDPAQESEDDSQKLPEKMERASEKRSTL